MRHSIECPGNFDIALFERQPSPRRHPDLLLDDVDAGDELGDGVLDLQPRVDLEEVEVAAFASIRNSNVPAFVYWTARAASTTVPPSLRRCFSVRATDGASSMSFWWRR